MEKLTFKTITSDHETDLFIRKIKHHSGVRLPLNYARSGKIVGVFLQKKLVAGYMIITKPGFRSLLFVPDKTKISNLFFKEEIFEMMEVNGLWIGPSLKKPSMQIKVWMHLIKDIFSVENNTYF